MNYTPTNYLCNVFEERGKAGEFTFKNLAQVQFETPKRGRTQKIRQISANESERDRKYERERAQTQVRTRSHKRAQKGATERFRVKLQKPLNNY